MSQQEFEMGSQSNQQNSSNEEDEIHQPQYPYSWSGKINPEGVPRDEPPSSYDATVLQQGYQAQTPNTTNAPGSQQAKVSSQNQYIPPAGDGDAYEQGYRPNNTFNQNAQGPGVPPWARPQHHRRDPVRFAFIILVLLGVGVLMAIFGSMGSVLGFIGGTIGALILVLLFIIFVPLLILFVIFGVIFRILRPRRAQHWYRRRGPWW
jgi:hypothetical protein